uniref:Uncharacterized protein n=1 Tax=Coccolithus braarudii TaxID=221442 RepID=A0A7S0Q380_9EUKA
MTSFFSPIPSMLRTPAPRVHELTRTDLYSSRGSSSLSLKLAPRTSLELTIIGTGGASGSAPLAGSHSTNVRPGRGIARVAVEPALHHQCLVAIITARTLW